MRSGRPWAGGGAAFVGLPASVVRAARKRAATSLTRAQPAPKPKLRMVSCQGYAELERNIGSDAALGVPALSCPTSTHVVGTEPSAGGSPPSPVPPAESGSAQGTQSCTLVVRPRRDMPEVKPFVRASKERALQMALSESSREEAIAQLERDMLANSSRDSVESKLRLYREFHDTWFGPGTSWLPVTPSSVTAVGAMLTAGRYSSGANYISAARVESRNKGHPEHPLLAHTVRKVVISIERGVGQQKQTLALPLVRLGELPGGDESWCVYGPVGPSDTVTIGS